MLVFSIVPGMIIGFWECRAKVNRHRVQMGRVDFMAKKGFTIIEDKIVL